jgi:serine/threonine protein kinase
MLVTEYCNQGDLSHWMKQKHSIDETISYMKQIADGDCYLHSKHIIHRDIKPQNILLHNGTIKICDFGFSTMIKDNLQLCSSICGTPLFMSPEILFGEKYNISSDIWALGILFYMMIYKVHPYGMLQHLVDYQTKIKKNNIIYDTIPTITNVINMIRKMLSKNVEERPFIDMIVYTLDHKLEIKREHEQALELDHGIRLSKKDKEIPNEEILFDHDIIEVDSKPGSYEDRINELEDHIFKLETVISESKSNKSGMLCCLGTDQDELNNGREVSGRHYKNNGYELQINQDYFDTVENKGIPIPKKTKSTKTITHNSYSPDIKPESKSSSSNKSFFSSSLDKVVSFLQHFSNPNSLH